MKQKQTIKLNETQLRGLIKESIKTILNEDEFTPHGYSADCNYGGKEIQLSDDGEMARLRTNYGDGPSKPTRWLKIYFNNDGVAYVMFKGRRLRLDQFMRY